MVNSRARRAKCTPANCKEALILPDKFCVRIVDVMMPTSAAVSHRNSKSERRLRWSLKECRCTGRHSDFASTVCEPTNFVCRRSCDGQWCSRRRLDRIGTDTLLHDLTPRCYLTAIRFTAVKGPEKDSGRKTDRERSAPSVNSLGASGENTHGRKYNCRLRGTGILVAYFEDLLDRSHQLTKPIGRRRRDQQNRVG